MGDDNYYHLHNLLTPYNTSTIHPPTGHLCPTTITGDNMIDGAEGEGKHYVLIENKTVSPEQEGWICSIEDNVDSAQPNNIIRNVYIFKEKVHLYSYIHTFL